jgi:hypothetical protein
MAKPSIALGLNQSINQLINLQLDTICRLFCDHSRRPRRQTCRLAASASCGSQWLRFCLSLLLCTLPVHPQAQSSLEVSYYSIPLSIINVPHSRALERNGSYSLQVSLCAEYVILQSNTIYIPTCPQASP